MEHQLRLFNNFPYPDTAISATRCHCSFSGQTVNGRDHILVTKPAMSNEHQYPQPTALYPEAGPLKLEPPAQ